MSMLDGYSEVLDCVYVGATDPDAWPGILEHVCDWLGVRKGVFFTPLIRLDQGGFAHAHGITQACIEGWAAPDAPQDLWAKKILELGGPHDGEVFIGSAVVPEPELVRDRWYTQFLSHHDLGRVMSGIIFGVWQHKTPVTSISFHRSLQEPDFGENERLKLELVLPHLSRALGVLMTLRDAEFKVAASREALNRIDTGIILWNEHGAIVFVNRACGRILEQQDGVARTTRTAGDGRQESVLSIQDGASRMAVDEAIRSALQVNPVVDHFHKAVTIDRPSGARPYTVQISTLSQRCTLDVARDVNARAIGFLSDPELPGRVNAQSLAAAYGLTQGEARAAVAWAEGGEMAHVANELGVSPNTLKTQISIVYQKMGISSRSAFVRLALAHTG